MDSMIWENMVLGGCYSFQIPCSCWTSFFCGNSWIESEYRLMSSTLHRNQVQYEVATRSSTVAHTPRKTTWWWYRNNLVNIWDDKLRKLLKFNNVQYITLWRLPFLLPYLAYSHIFSKEIFPFSHKERIGSKLEAHKISYNKKVPPCYF